jgi:hypothetical protein
MFLFNFRVICEVKNVVRLLEHSFLELSGEKMENLLETSVFKQTKENLLTEPQNFLSTKLFVSFSIFSVLNGNYFWQMMKKMRRKPTFT